MSNTNRTNNQVPFRVIELASEALKQVCPDADPTSECYSVNDVSYYWDPRHKNYSISFANREGNKFNVFCSQLPNRFECALTNDPIKMKYASGCGGAPTDPVDDDITFNVDVADDSAAGSEASVPYEEPCLPGKSDRRGCVARADDVATETAAEDVQVRPDAKEDIAKDENNHGGADVTFDVGDDSVLPELKEELPAEPVCQEVIEIEAKATAGNDDSWGAQVSGDGHSAVFFTRATNLIDGDDNDAADIVLVNLETGAAELVNNVSGGFDYSPAGVLIGGSCEYASGIPFVGEPESDGYTGEIFTAAIDHDGDKIAYSSRSKSLAEPFVDATAGSDIFLYDRQTGQSKLITIGNDGKQPNVYCAEALNPSISDDGRLVAFVSSADYTGLDECGIRAYVYDDVMEHVFQLTPTNSEWQFYEQLPTCENWMNPATEPRISGDGSLISLTASSIAYLGNTMSCSQGGDNANGFITGPADGAVTAINYNNDGQESSVKLNAGLTPNYDGTLLSIESSDANILGGGIALNGKRQAFVRDLTVDGGVNFLVSSNALGEEADEDARRATISADGHWVVFDSKATNLIEGLETHGVSQVYLKNIETGEVTLVSKGLDGHGGKAMSAFADISNDGSVVVFESEAANLTPSDWGERDVFAFFRETGEVKKLSQHMEYTEKTKTVCQ